MSTPTLSGPPRRLAVATTPHPVRNLAVWGLGAATAGAVVGLGIELLVMSGGQRFDGRFIKQPIFFAVAVALTALMLSRYVLPLLEASLSPLLRYGIVLVTLTGTALATTAVSIAQDTTVVFTTKARYFLFLVGANALLAITVGGALIAWEQLRRSLERAYESLREKEALEQEMTLAREVQQELLPKAFPVCEHLDVAFTCQSAKQVGGDMLDFVPLGGGCLGLVIGDVIGKGMAAALMMANLQALVRALAPLERDPGRLNALLSEVIAGRVSAGRFVTLAYLVLDPATGAMQYSLAGHHPPIVAGAGDVRLLEAGGLPLGLFADACYPGGTDCLEYEETVVLYTDGLIEAMHEADPDDQFGHDRLKDLIREHHRSGSGTLLARILEALDAHTRGAGPTDDTTILIVRRLPCQKVQA